MKIRLIKIIIKILLRIILLIPVFIVYTFLFLKNCSIIIILCYFYIISIYFIQKNDDINKIDRLINSILKKNMTNEERNRLDKIGLIIPSIVVLEDDKQLELLGWIESLSEKEKEYVLMLIASGIEWCQIDEEP